MTDSKKLNPKKRTSAAKSDLVPILIHVRGETERKLIEAGRPEVRKKTAQAKWIIERWAETFNPAA